MDKITGTRCPSCMNEHEPQHVIVQEQNMFKGHMVEYTAQYTYCEHTDEMFADEQQISLNDISMKDAYREKMGLLTSRQIVDLREQYRISQSDLCLILGWGGKTITRYEGHQVQDRAHDMVLRKLASDPAWFLTLLAEKQEDISASSFASCRDAGLRLYAAKRDAYLQGSIMSRYAEFQGNPEATGNKNLCLEVVADMVNYFANAATMRYLFTVKLMKLLWYADALSYKRRGHSISGLVYRALPMGAVPICYESIPSLSAVRCQQIETSNGVGCKFIPSDDSDFRQLSADDMEILDVVIGRFAKATKNQIVNAMHEEEAYQETESRQVILFRPGQRLSLS